MPKKKNASKWMKLDNAALIYPATMNRSWTALFRLSATLTERVDEDILEVAQKRTLRRLPWFAYKLKRGLFWFYLEHSDDLPRIEEDVANPCVRMRLNENDGFCMRVRYYHNRIAVEFFHVLTDGTGGQVFLQTLVAEYLRLKYGANIPRGDKILDCSEPSQPEETEDSFAVHSGKITQSRKEVKAYHIKGTDERSGFVHIITGSMNAADVLAKAREKGVSVTEYLTAALILSVDAIQRRRVPSVHKYKPVKLSVPINLRNVFPSKTLRNFANYVNPGIDPRLGEYTFDETLNIVHHFMAMEVTPKLLNVKITTNVRSERNAVLRLMPLFIKNMALKYVYSQVGDALSSTTLSNLGVAKLPEEMAQYVRRMDFILGPLADNRVCCASLTYNGRLRVNFTRTIAEPVLEREFFTRLVKLGIPVKVESNQQS
ncbi:MAG: hypothetical protein GX417_03345 [Clostridiales bacterium]|nr:hypothetical protein [Clostridiales bacterium]